MTGPLTVVRHGVKSYGVHAVLKEMREMEGSENAWYEWGDLDDTISI